VRIALVSMPWAAVDYPSLALGELTTLVELSAPQATVDTYYENLAYVDWLDSRHAISAADYEFFAVDSYLDGVGDWVFSAALHGLPDWRLDELEQFLSGRVSAAHLDLSRTLHRLAPAFIADAAERINTARPDIVGFTTTFQQNVASLALARRLKTLRPDLTIVFGGANCDGPQGAALHRNHQYVDFVVRGEAEPALPKLIDGLAGTGDFTTIDGLCWRTADGRSVANAQSGALVPPARIAKPNFDAYFARWERSRASRWKEPALVLEGARGCWWGEKHHCTFCGLNGSSMKFRSKQPDAVFEEMVELSQRHRVLDIVMVDNILDMAHLNHVMPKLSAAQLDLRIHYEIKSNLRRRQLEALSAAGVTVVQPGIESLNARVLSLMRKGVTGCQNVRLLRDAEGLGMTVSWNYLYGFPGEADNDYLPIIDQLPALHHLMPPSGSTRIAIERFSPYFDDPTLGFAKCEPAKQYKLIYALDDDELRDLAYVFDSPPQGIDEKLAETLGRACDTWRRQYGSSRLTYSTNGSSTLLVNSRPAFDWQYLAIEEPVHRAILQLLDDPHQVGPLAQKASAICGGDVSVQDVATLIASWRRSGIVFCDGDTVVHVATPATNQEILRR
jgi:ribosomal peptide maturation radical SAM protein 1